MSFDVLCVENKRENNCANDFECHCLGHQDLGHRLHPDIQNSVQFKPGLIHFAVETCAG